MNCIYIPKNLIENPITGMKNPSRLPHKRLLLICEMKLGENYQWLLPQAMNKDGETLRQVIKLMIDNLIWFCSWQTAERSLEEHCSTRCLNIKYFGNSPCAVYKYIYPKPIRDKYEDIKGGKIFFFKAQHVDGNFDLEKADENLIKDFKWVSRLEAENIFKKQYYEALSSSFLIEELPQSQIDDLLDFLVERKTQNKREAIKQ